MVERPVPVERPRRSGRAALIEECVHVEAEREREELEQLIGEAAAAAPELLGRRSEVRWFLGPDVPGVPPGILLPQRLVRHVDHAEGERLLHVGRRVDAVGGCVRCARVTTCR